MVTATRSRKEKRPSTRDITRSTKGSSASAWPRSIAKVSSASGSAVSCPRTQAEQAPRAVSIARMRNPSLRLGVPPGRLALELNGEWTRNGSSGSNQPSDRLHLAHIGEEMAKEVLDAVAQRRRRGGAA